MNDRIHRDSVFKRGLQVVHNPFRHSDGAAKLLKVQRKDIGNIHVPYRFGTDVFKLNPQQGTGQAIAEAAIIHKELYLGDAFRAILDLIEKNECLTRDHGHIGKSRDPRQDILRRLDVIEDGNRCWGLEEVNLYIMGIMPFGESPESHSLADLPRACEKERFVTDLIKLIQESV